MTVNFNEDRWVPTRRNGQDYYLSYSCVDTELVGKPEEQAKTKHGDVTIGISRTLASMWGLENQNLQKVLFEYGKRHIETMVSQKALSEKSEIRLTSTNTPQKCPFDPSRINVEFGVPFEFRQPTESTLAKAQESSLPFQIVTTRDNINAVFLLHHRNMKTYRL